MVLCADSSVSGFSQNRANSEDDKRGKMNIVQGADFFYLKMSILKMLMGMNIVEIVKIKLRQ